MSPRVSRRKFLFTGAGIAASGAYLLAQGQRGRIRARARPTTSGGGGGSQLTSNDFTYRGVFNAPYGYAGGSRDTWSQGLFGFNGSAFHFLPHNNGGSASGVNWNDGITAVKASAPSLLAPADFTVSSPITHDRSGVDLLPASLATALVNAGARATETAYYGNISPNTYNLVSSPMATAGVVTSVMWDAANSRYLVAYNSHYGTPGGTYGNPVLFAFTPDASGTGFSCDGPWRANHSSQSFGHHLAPVPASWQSTYGFRSWFGMAQRRDQITFAGFCLHDFDVPAPGTTRDTPSDFGGGNDAHTTIDARQLSFFAIGSHHQSKEPWMQGGKWYRAFTNAGGAHLIDPPVLLDNTFEGSIGDAESYGSALDMWSTFIPIHTTSGKDGILTMGQVCAPASGVDYGTTDGPEAWYFNATGCAGPSSQGQTLQIGQGCAGPGVTSSVNIYAFYSPAQIAEVKAGTRNVYDTSPYETGRMHAFANNANFQAERTGNFTIGIDAGMGLFIPAAQNPWGSWDAVVIASQGYRFDGTYDPIPFYHVFEVA